MTNLEVCVLSAERFVSTATNMVSSRETVPPDTRRSELADLTDQRRHEISSWIPKPADVGSDIPGGTVTTDTTFDREYVNMQTLLKLARLAYIAQEYDEAKVLLESFRTRSETRYGPNFEERNKVLEMLGTTYCRLKEWEDVEDILHLNFDGREKIVKSLVWCYCEQSRWDDAERLLCGTIDSESLREPDIEYTLAEVYLAKGDYDKAIKLCDKILRTLGDDHVLFYLCLGLLTQIYEAKGDIIEVKLHQDLLPPGIEGFSIFQNSLI
jgi:tetratricopeptide (TPR) repeat protein